jgi:class 3 adenylate cyclase
VLFSDLSGFTAMSEHLDPEEVRAVMNDIFARATSIIDRYGGRVDKLLGDAVMAVFGDPTAHEDDAERAVRAVLEIHAAVDELSPKVEASIGRPLIMHSGINTGVVVTSGTNFDTADTGPLGDTINLAARLEDLSEAGEILLGPTTANLVDGVFVLEDHGSHALKGKTGLVPVVKVAGFKESRSGPSRRQGAFVGRHEELGILMAAVEKVQDGEGSVIGIRAEAGTGKTRLLAEFQGRVGETIQWLEGRAYAFGENIPFAPLVDLISNAVGINENDTQDSIAAKLEEGMSDIVTDLERVLDPFRRLYGLPERSGSGLDKETFQPRLLESMLDVVTGLCARAPTVLVFQDLHWADPSTVSIIANLAENVEVPVVIVTNYRPEFDGKLPEMREIDLKALSPRQSGDLTSSLLDGSEPPQELVDFVVERTDGNPFFLEEIINSLIETGTLAATDGTWEVTGSLMDADVPTSVRGVIAARIDRLEPSRRKVLREASVVGRDFLYEVIREVASETDTLDPSLSALETADLIRERDDQEDLEYFFKHALTQDVAYEGLLKQDRVRLHARAAAAIEKQFAGRLEEVTETLAFHYAQGAVRDKAVHYLRTAGRKAMARFALVEAGTHFENAYDLVVAAEESEQRDRELVETILDWSVLFYYLARLPDLGSMMDRHQDSVDRLGDDDLLTWWLLWRGHTVSFGMDQSDNLADLDAALEIARRTGDEKAVRYAETWKIFAFALRGRLSEAIEVGERIEPAVRAARYEDPYPFFKSQGVMALVLTMSGRYGEVEAICAEMIEFGRETGNNRSIAFGMQGLAFLALTTLSFQTAIDISHKSKEIATDPIYSETVKVSWASAAALAGDTAEARKAIEDLRRSLATGVRLPLPFMVRLVEGFAMLGEGELSKGMDELIATGRDATSVSREWEALEAELFICVAFTRISTRSAASGLKDLARNPGFVKYVRQARKETGQRLVDVITRCEAEGALGLIPIFRYHYAIYLLHGGDTATARRQLEDCMAELESVGVTEGTERVRSLLASIPPG